MAVHWNHPRRENVSTRLFRIVSNTLLLVILTGGVGYAHAGEHKDHLIPDITHHLQSASPSACPTAPSGLPNMLEYTNFCVYYNTTDTTQQQAADIGADTQSSWNRFVNDFGMLAPLVTGTKMEVHIENNFACDGSAWNNHIKVFNGCLINADERMKSVAHELFHRVQFHYDSGWSNWSSISWMYEGTARVMEDSTFTNIDHWTNALSAWFSFYISVNDYLANTNADITSHPMRYRSCLWWKYFAEKYGKVTTEPGRGVDAIRELWEAVQNKRDISAVNAALSSLGTGLSFDAAFKRFAAANYMKDLTGLPSNVYNYLDEEETGSPAYGPLTPLSQGNVSLSKSVSWTNKKIERYGIEYMQTIPATDCTVLSVAFKRTSGSESFYHIVTQKGNTLASFREGSGSEWKQSFVNNGLTKATAIAGSLGTSSTLDVTFSCAKPALSIKQPNTSAPANVGPYNNPGKFLVQVLVTNGTATGPVVAGLSKNDFSVAVNNKSASITAGGFVQEQYWLVVQAPQQTANGTYDLKVSLKKPGTTTVIISTTNSKSVTYAANNLDHVLVIDNSGSMGEGAPITKMQAARQAAAFYTDITRDNDGLAVVSFSTDVTGKFNMQKVTSAVRNNAKAFINSLTPEWFTSIGDGMDEAANQRNNSPTKSVNKKCSFVLLSDGMENEPKMWSDVSSKVKSTNCPVTSIAFGPESDETLMENIAKTTGGSYRYNDVYVSTSRARLPGGSPSAEMMALDLGDVFEYARTAGIGWQRILAEKGALESPDAENYHSVVIDDSVDEVLFTLDWPYEALEMQMILVDPTGNEIRNDDWPYTFLDFTNGHLGWIIDDPEPGTWTVRVFQTGGWSGSVPYQIVVSGETPLSASLLLPDWLGTAYLTGTGVPIFALLSEDSPIDRAELEVLITAPDGHQLTLPLFDDGQHQDGEAGDGLYGNRYTRTNRAEPVSVTGEDGASFPTEPKDEGSYHVRLFVWGENFTRQALGGFTILEDRDANANGLPDGFEERYGPYEGDPDLDYLINWAEYEFGTDPLNSDTDGGGENDFSEWINGLNPHNPGDDQVEAPEFLKTEAQINGVVLNYDVKEGYETLLLYRSASPNGPWTEVADALPLEGQYFDPVPNGQKAYYRLLAATAHPHITAVISSEPVTPSNDPFPPEARLLINNGASSTKVLPVRLLFEPIQRLSPDEVDVFSDIVEMMISNGPHFSGATWQTFESTVPWEIQPGSDGWGRVYARFRDANGNVSIGVTTAAILYDPFQIFLPYIGRD